MKEKLMQLMQEAEAKMASISSLQEAEELRVKLLGKKGELTEMLKGMKALAPEDRKTFGQAANEARAKIENTLNERMEYFRNAQKELALAAERVDVTEPAVHRELGSRHLLSVTIDEITSCFRSMGFSVVEGPEVETVFNNFDALNAGPNHPARDITDTFYITDDVLLRTQTSRVQVRTLLSQKPPIKVIAPGRCFRCDTPDATHSPMFHQVEGLVVDEGITMADLKGVLDQFAKQMFGSSTRTKFRPHRTLRGDGRLLLQVRRQGLQGLQGIRLDRNSWLRHGAPERSEGRRHRHREIHGLCLRHGRGAHRNAQVRSGRHPSAVRERHPLRQAVQIRRQAHVSTDQMVRRIYRHQRRRAGIL